MRRSPYQGLVPFGEEDSEYFFGREAEIEIADANLRASRLTVLYGSSGAGKSSVLRAGVVRDAIAAARSQAQRGRMPDLLPLYCKEWAEDPAAALAEAYREALAAAELPPPPGAVDLETLTQAAGKVARRLVLILDQFEEYLTYHGSSGSPGNLDRWLASILTDAAMPVNVMFALREDALARLDQFKGQLPGLFYNYLRIEPLDFAAAREAIQRPVPVFCRQEGLPEVKIEDELVEAVLTQVRAGTLVLREGVAATGPSSGTDRVEAPYLQLVLTRLWDEERKAGSSVMRRDTLKRLGEATSIVRSHLGDTMREVLHEDQAIAERMFFHLVTPSGTKIAHALADLAEFTGFPAAEIQRVAGLLASPDRRILRAVRPPNDPNGAPRYEIYHDALAEPILAWQRAFRGKLREEQVAAQLAQREQEARARLQAEQQESERRRRTWFLGLTAFAAIVVAALFIVVFRQRAQIATAQAAQAADVSRKAQDAASVASRRLELTRNAQKVREAVLSGSNDRIQLVEKLAVPETNIKFTASAEYLGYSNPAGDKVYQFKLRPDPKTVKSGSIAYVIYLANHPTFHNNIMVAGPSRDYTVTYVGWGCLTRIVALIEFTDPDQPQTKAEFNMCKAIGWNVE